MQKFVLDTGIVLGYIRAAGYAEYVEKKYAPFTPPNIPLISVVSKGEIYSLAKQFGWGGGKLKPWTNFYESCQRSILAMNK